jgi:hypothetical protein
MGNSVSSYLRMLFENALGDYKQQTGIGLAEHPLAVRLQDCDSVESVTAIFFELVQGLKEYRENDKIIMPLIKVLAVLHRLPFATNFAQDVGGLVCPSAPTECLTSLTLVL